MKKAADYDISPEELAAIRGRFDLTIAEAAPVLRMSETSLYRKISNGEIDCWRSGEGKTATIFLRYSDLVRYMVNKQGRRLPET